MTNEFINGYNECMNDMSKEMDRILKEEIDFDICDPAIREGVSNIVSTYFSALKDSMEAYKKYYEEDIE
jgi:hypothetical protein